MIQITVESTPTYAVRLGNLALPAADRTDANELAKKLAETINLYSMTSAEVDQ